MKRRNVILIAAVILLQNVGRANPPDYLSREHVDIGSENRSAFDSVVKRTSWLPGN